MTASKPVGGIKATRLVPCALCWSKANNKPKIGIRTVPPPMPKRPDRIPPATPARRKPIVLLISASALRRDRRLNRDCLFGSLTPKQQGRKHQKCTEQLLEVIRRHWHGDTAAEVTPD